MPQDRYAQNEQKYGYKKYGKEPSRPVSGSRPKDSQQGNIIFVIKPRTTLR